MKNMDMLEWMSDLDARYLEEAERPVLKKRHQLRKTLPALIAAAAVAIGATVGVSAYAGWNSSMLRGLFGTDGAAEFSQTDFPLPVEYYSEDGSVTVETVLNDGVRMLMVLSCEKHENELFLENLSKDPTEQWYHPISFCQMSSEDGTRLDYNWESCAYEFSDETKDYYTFSFMLSDFPEEDIAYLTFFTPEGIRDRMICHYDGIRIPVINEQNTPIQTYVSETGEQMQLSSFEIICDIYCRSSMVFHQKFSVTMNDGTQYPLYSKGGRAEPTAEFTHGEKILWHANSTVFVPNDEAALAERDQHNGFYRGSQYLGNPDDYISFLNISEIQAIEMDGVTYTKVQ